MVIESRKFQAGNVIRLESVADWLLNGLTEAEQQVIRGCVGTEMTISKIDKWGGIWVGVGTTTEDGDWAEYVGQSFLVEPDRISLISPRTQKVEGSK